MHLKLRDSEVANDDFERQARNTTSSLEDMESKYNQAIERGVMLEEEIKIGEQERERLRIESQRLKEELSDLKIEAELLQAKMKKQEARHLSTISTDMSALGSPTFDKNADASPISTASSPMVTTPPESKSSVAGTVDSDAADPPSPPMSDASAPLPKATGSGALAGVRTPAASSRVTARGTRLPSANNSITPKPRTRQQPATSTRVTGSRLSAGAPGGAPLRTPANRSTAARKPPQKYPTSNSLSHIRSLTAQMQRLEARVHSARSKLPAPTHTPPHASPRGTTEVGSMVPSTVTIRSRKRTIGSTASSSIAGDEPTPTQHTATPGIPKPSHGPRLSTSGISRLSFGPHVNRPTLDGEHSSRPSSRASISSYTRPASRTDMIPPPRPVSRASLSGARTPLSRPRSSMGGSVHGHTASMSRVMDLEEEDEGEGDFRTPSRRGTYSKLDDGGAMMSGIPMPGSSIPAPPGNRRQSGAGLVGAGRRTSTGLPVSGRQTPSGRQSAIGSRRLGDLGETF